MPQDQHIETDTPFRTCSKCGFKWKSRQQFVDDNEIAIIGYQGNFIDMAAGLFYFNHSCKGTFTIRANVFEDLYDGSIFEKSIGGSGSHSDFCLRHKDSRACPVKCECAYVEEITRIFTEKRITSSPETAMNEV